MTKNEFPRLYKKTSTGSIQYWDISTVENKIITKYGQLGTKNEQVTTDVIKSGKSKGKKNETNPESQAMAEAKASWEKHLKKGYVQSLQDAADGIRDKIIEGGVDPMLAFVWDDHKAKLKLENCYISRKLDGIRCIAILKDGKCTLWSRTRKPILSVPHIVKEIEESFKTDIILDGELFNPKFSDDFEHIVHLVKQQKEPDPHHTDVEYHIFDAVGYQDYVTRMMPVFNIVSAKYLKPLSHYIAKTEEDVINFAKMFVQEGYEGAMVRDISTPYEHKRSYTLQKVKFFFDSEFEIVGVEEGRGKLAGHAGAIVCKMENGTEFKAKPDGSVKKLKEYFENKEKLVGKLLTVKYQGLTRKNGVPRFPVGLRIREYA